MENKDLMVKVTDNGDGTYNLVCVPDEQMKKVEQSCNAYSATIVPGPPAPFFPSIMGVPPLLLTYPQITIWSTGLILSDYQQTESEACCGSEDLVVHTPQIEKPKETITDKIGGDECCELLLNLLVSLILEKGIKYAESREDFAQNSEQFLGFENGIRLYIQPLETYAFLADQLMNRETNVKIPTIAEFEQYLYRENVLEAEEGENRRYRKKVKVGDRRIRLWVLHEAELFNSYKETKNPL